MWSQEIHEVLAVPACITQCNQFSASVEGTAALIEVIKYCSTILGPGHHLQAMKVLLLSTRSHDKCGFTMGLLAAGRDGL